MLRTSPKAGAIRRRMPSCSSMRRSRCSRSSRLRRASRRAAGRCSSWRVRREDATVRAGRLRGARVRRRRRRAGKGLAEGRGSAHGTIIARTGVPRATLRRPRERASALQRHLALLLQAAEDGVGDLHPLGIGMLRLAEDHQARSRPGTPRRRRSRWWSRSCSAGAGPPAPVAQAAWRSCVVAAPSASSCRPAGASGRSASRRLPSPGPGSCRRRP